MRAGKKSQPFFGDFHQHIPPLKPIRSGLSARIKKYLPPE
jgi:hypothetical protein